MIEPPHGMPAVLRVFGNPTEYLECKAAWEHSVLEVRKLPRPLPYAYLPHTEVTQIRAHRLVVDLMVEAIAKSLEAGVPPERLTYGGSYCWRAMRGSTRLSLHTWGVAIDIDPANNPMGRPWNSVTGLHPTVVEIFEGLGFTWGGRWAMQRVDPMHAQFASGV